MDAKTGKTEAIMRLDAARKIMDMTYPLVHEPKLFLPVIEYLYDAFNISIDALLESRTINFDKTNFELKIDIFSKNYSPELNLNPENKNNLIEFMLLLNKTLKEHKDASVEFIRDEKFIISDNDYNMTALSFNSVNDMLSKSENYINEMFSQNSVR
jgi:hypothetical protein